MIKQVLAGMDYQFWAEGGLLLFLIAFCVVTVQALVRRRHDIDSMARIPLDD
ncbi:MAG TPA: hypothetical protein PLI18_14515 [Pirellulaceae bacterium]|nr:hypothetical protein [Pirellulaceae bacterium]